MIDPLLSRYQWYFRHSDDDHDVLDIGDRSIACTNVRRALPMLDVEVVAELSAENLYDQSLKDAVKAFQTKYRHRVADGLVGPGTRALLVSELFHRYPVQIFARLKRPEM